MCLGLVNMSCDCVVLQQQIHPAVKERLNFEGSDQVSGCFRFRASAAMRRSFRSKFKRKLFDLFSEALLRELVEESDQ